MKLGKVVKSFEVNSNAMDKINSFTRKELAEDDVYIFPMVMCDNELDRDYDKFEVETLKTLAELYKGKTVIFDHFCSAANQTARIFDTEVVHVPNEKTFDGTDLYQLVGYAYMLKSEATQEIINNLDAGILKEVSVNCNVGESKCSICGNDYFFGDCQHYKSRQYDGKTCFTYLGKAKDAYEVSFVAVPAQPGAGVTKSWYDDTNSKKSKGAKNIMNYEEIKSSLAEMGIELDSVAKEKGVVPELNVILGAIKKKFDEIPKAKLDSTEEFISAEKAKNFIGKEMAAEEILEAAKSFESVNTKAKAYDTIKSKAIDDAVASGIRARGESFNEERYKKLFETSTIEEIKGWQADFDKEAENVIHKGRKSEDSETPNGVGTTNVNLNDYKF